MNFKKWVKSIQTVGYNGARTVLYETYESARSQLFKSFVEEHLLLLAQHLLFHNLKTSKIKLIQKLPRKLVNPKFIAADKFIIVYHIDKCCTTVICVIISSYCIYF